MSQETTMQDVLEAVQTFATHTDQQFSDIRTEMKDIRTDMVTKDDLKAEISGVRTDMVTKDDLKAEIKDVRGDMRFGFAEIRADMVTKDEFKNELAQVKNELMTEIDRFVVLHQTLDIELVSLRVRCERMESFMVKVAKRLDLDYQPA